jgi:hypothetical protein
MSAPRLCGYHAMKSTEPCVDGTTAQCVVCQKENR